MASIVEICGAPGVGKSTIFYELGKFKQKNNTWETVSIFNPFGDETRIDFFKRILNAYKRNKKTVSKETDLLYKIKLIVREFKKGRNYVDPLVLKEAGDRFTQEYPKYVDACWNNIFFKQKQNLNGMDLRFEKAEFIYRIIKKIQVLRESKKKKHIIIDEGLINLIDRGLYKNVNEEQEIDDLLNTMPLPTAIIHLDIDITEHIRRLCTRADIRDMHRGLSLEELQKITENCKRRILTTVQLMEKRGLPVLYLDSGNSIEYNCKEIINFTENIKKNIPIDDSSTILSTNAF